MSICVSLTLLILIVANSCNLPLLPYHYCPSRIREGGSRTDCHVHARATGRHHNAHARIVRTGQSSRATSNHPARPRMRYIHFKH